MTMTFNTTSSRANLTSILLVCLAACGNPRQSEWQDIDYSSVYRANAGRENDTGYTAPATSCVNDEIFGCQ